MHECSCCGNSRIEPIQNFSGSEAPDATAGNGGADASASVLIVSAPQDCLADKRDG